ncbi:DUF7507 domain-containing protein [Geodermatophilus sp. FMUSA9-8]|uniref:DUF7507 domain-containing protein n=1 Tax=Geodermatophilus sp. FMUSA9-8 TaxID=3120155 RepID=UPI003008292B
MARTRGLGWPARVSALVLAGALATGVVAVVPGPQALAVQDPTSCGTTAALQNGGFELPVLADNSYAFVAEGSVPGWRTTASDKRIEIWRTPFQGVSAGSGSQFAELNATQPSTLYQDVTTTPGTTLRWELQHRGRAGTDVMAVNIGAPNGTLARQALISDGTSAWGTHSGTYSVPAGQTTTRFAFAAVTTAGGNASVGNFLDSISFGTSACLVTTTQVTTRSGGATANVGELLTYTVTTSNGGGNPAKDAVVVDQLPAGVEFVPGSIRAITSTSTQARSDAAGDDAGEYDAATRTVRVRVGLNANSSAGGTIRPDDARSISYQVRVTEALSGTTVRNDARVQYRDDLTASARTSTSDEAATPVGAAADLAVTATRTTPDTLAGRPVTWTVTTRADGPSTEPAARTTIELPVAADGTTPGLTGVTATTSGGSCAVGPRAVTCDHGALAAGASRTTTVTGTVPAATPPGTVYRLLASVTGNAYDHVPDDNTAAAVDAVTARADLAVDLTADRATGTAGEPVTYTAVVTNAGPSLARGVVLTDPLGAGMRLDAVSTTATGGTCARDAAADTVQCTLGDLAPGATATVVLQVTLDPTGDGALGNAVSVTSATPDPNGRDNQDEVAGAGEARADLGITLRLPVTEALPGQTVPFTAEIRNAGPSDAVNVTVHTVLPPGFRVTRLTGLTCTATAGCRIDRIAPGRTVTVEGDALVLDDAPEGTTTARVRVVSPTPDGSPADDVADVSVTVRLEADLQVSQVLENPDDPAGPLVAGGPLHAVATVRNAGPTRAEGVVLRQVVPAGQPVPAWVLADGSCAVEGAVDGGGVAVDGAVVVCTLDELAAGSTWTVDLGGRLRASYKDDRVVRTRTVSAASPDPVAANDTSTASTPAVRRSDVRVAKTTSTPSVVQTEEVAFTVTVTNDGPSDARDVFVREAPRPGLLVTGALPDRGTYSDSNGAWRIPYLAAGQTATLQVDGRAADAEDAVNEVRFVSADDPDPQPANDVAAATVDVHPADRSLTVTTRASVLAPGDRAAGLRAGDVLAFEYVVTNPGNVSTSAVSVSDTLVPGGVTCPVATLAAHGGTTTCTANGTYRVTQADVDAGTAVGGVAVVRGRAPDSTADLEFGSAGDPVPVAPAGSALTSALVADWEDADGDDALDAGERVVWTVVVTNTGQLTVGSLRVEGTGTPVPSCPVDLLAPGERTSCVTAPYVLTAADVAAGQHPASAEAVGVTPRGNTAVRSAAAATRFPAAPAPALALTVAGVVDPAERQAAAALGDPITWHHVVTNVGNVPVTGIAVDAPGQGPVVCAATELDPGASTECAATTPRPVTEDDLLTGTVTGRATATGTPAAVGGLVRSAPAEHTVGLTGVVRALVVTSTAHTPGSVAAVRTGDEVGWTYDVHNDGNLTMRLVEVGDELVGRAACARDVLAPGERTSCTAGGTHRVTQAGFDAGLPLVNAARVSGIPTGSDRPLLFGPASASVPMAAARPSLSAVHVADWDDADGDGALDAGETIGWSLVVTNTGDVTLADLQTAAPVAGVMTCGAPSLAPGERTTCTASPYTAADATPVTSRASASAADPRGGPRVASGESTVTTPSTLAPALEATVAPDVTPGAAPGLGDRVRWRYTVTNTGNVPLDAVAVEDPEGGVVSCAVTSLRPGRSTDCTGSAEHTVTEADLRAGHLDADAVAAGTPGAAPVVRSATATGRLHLAPVVRALDVRAAATGTAARAGDLLTYTWTVVNTGNVTMAALAVTDSAGGTPGCDVATLAPGARAVCTGSTYRVSQADLDAGLPVGLTGTATALPAAESDRLPFGPAADPVVVGAVSPALVADKRPGWTDADGDRALDAGETVVWTVLVSNTGDVTLDDVRVDDPTVFVGCGVVTLAPGEDVLCVSDADPVTATDAATGTRSNTATALAVSRRDGAAVSSAPATAAVTTTPAPALTLLAEAVRQSGAGPAPADLGETVGRRYRVVNTGNVPVGGVAVVDASGVPAVCEATLLAPGASTTCTPAAGHVVTEGDLISGEVRTSATATGTAALSGGPVASAPAAVAVATAAPRAGVQLILGRTLVAGSEPAALRVGDLVRTRYRVLNTGTLTLSGIVVTDPGAGPVTCRRTVLAPSESTTCTADRPHAVTAEDVAAGQLTSWAMVTAAAPVASGLGTVGSTATVTESLTGPDGGPATPPTAAGPVPSGTPVPVLARTGAEPAVPAGLGVLLVLGGGLLVWGSRRRSAARR